VSNEELFKRFHLNCYKYYSKDDLAKYCRIIVKFNKYLLREYTNKVILTKEGNV
jgi:hypothetical protein